MITEHHFTEHDSIIRQLGSVISGQFAGSISNLTVGCIIVLPYIYIYIYIYI
jgi:hypothetical protein